MARPRIGDERREQILAAFETCVLRNGIEKTTLEDVAREAGQPRSLVRYFAGNRDALISLLIDRLVDRTAQRMAGMHTRGKGSAANFVKVFFGEFYGDELGNRIAVELWHMGMRSADLRARLFTVYERVLRDFASELPGADANGVNDAAYATYALGLGAAVLTGLGLPPGDPERLLQIAQGLAAGAVPAPGKPRS